MSKEPSIIANRMIGTFRYILNRRMDKRAPQLVAADVCAPGHPWINNWTPHPDGIFSAFSFISERKPLKGGSFAVGESRRRRQSLM
jgi:hypothetical protein